MFNVPLNNTKQVISLFPPNQLASNEKNQSQEKKNTNKK